MAYERKLDAKLVVSIIAAGIMSFAGVVVETAMNVTFPTLMNEFGIATATVQWITTGYLLVLSVVIPASSYLHRRFTIKQIFAFGGSSFLIGTLIAALAPNFIMLLIGRLIEGVGTGVALPLMFNIIFEQVPLRNLGLMVGVGNLIPASAPAIGPSAGGFLVSAFSWRAVFWVLVPLIALSLIAGLVCIREVGGTSRPPFDTVGLIMLTIGFAGIIFAANAASSAGWLSIEVIGLFAIAVVALALFSRHSLRSTNAILNVRVFRSPVFTLSVLAVLMVQFITLGLGFLIPNFAQITQGTDAFIAGCLLVPGCLAGAVISPFAGGILDRFGAAKPLIAGCVGIVCATIAFAVCTPLLTSAMIIVIYFVYSISMATTMPTNMTNALSHLQPEQKADGNATINTAQQLAGAIGTAIVSTVVAAAQDRVPSDLAQTTEIGTQEAFMLLIGFAVVEAAAMVMIFGVLRNRQPAQQ